MCGIACYVGSPRKINFLISALEKLEYRGYDSAGVGFLEKSKLVRVKSVGNIEKFKNKIDLNKSVTCVISHTRWATHGKVTEENAHPHFSKNAKWGIVHNGIIENYQKIRQKLEKFPSSETDTAVVAQLLEDRNVSGIEDFIKTFKEIEGSYAIVGICKNISESLFLAKKNSPMFVAKNGKDFLVVSDLVCVKDFSMQFYEMGDGEFACISGGDIKFYNNSGTEISKTSQQVTDDFQNVSKENYPHFMLKEICEESKVVKNQVAFYQNNKVLEEFDAKFLSDVERVKFVGCGTAYHAGLIGANFCEDILGIPASAEVASEFVYRKTKFISQKELYVFVSQSGETADTIKALEIVKNKGAKFISLTNVMHSSIAKKSKYVLPVCAGVEIAVASTKAYVCQLTALYMFFSHLAEIRTGAKLNYYQDVLMIAEKISKINFQKIEKIAEYISKKNEVVFIGKGIDYVTASEASLKLKEISYINSFEFMSGELKHGYLALIENNTPIFVFACNKELNSKTMNSAKEAEARGAKIILITNDEKLAKSEDVIWADETNSHLCSILSIVPMQYLAYRVSVKKNINPDQPRNLAKSVTVE